MRQIVFPNSPILAMLAASFFQGLTAFYASLLSLNLILICLTIVCEISSVMCSSYPKRGIAAIANKATNSSSITTFNGGNNKAGSIGRGIGAPWGNNENSKKFDEYTTSRSTGNGLEIRIDNYDKRNGDDDGDSTTIFPTLHSQNDVVDGELGKAHLDEMEKADLQLQQMSDGNEKLKSTGYTPTTSLTATSTNVTTFQVLSPKLNNPLRCASSSPSLLSTALSSSSSPVTSDNYRETGDCANSCAATPTSILNGSSWRRSATQATSPSVLMVKIMEELEPTVVVGKAASSSSPCSRSVPEVRKLLCPPPTYRMKSSVEVLFTKSFTLYRQTQLLVLFINSAMFNYFPVVISAGMVLVTLSAYATVKLHSILPLPIRLSIVLIGLTISTVMWLLMMESTQITSHSDEFLRYWRCRLKKKYTRQQLRTCPKLCFRIGPFLDFQKDTIFGVFSTIQHYTVNMTVINLA